MPLNPQLLSLALQIGQQRQQQAIREQERAEKRKDDLFDQLLSLRTKGVPLKSVEPFAVSQGIGSDRLELLRGLDKTLRQAEKSQESEKQATGLAEQAGGLLAGTAGVGGKQQTSGAEEQLFGQLFQRALVANSQTQDPLGNLPAVENTVLQSRAKRVQEQQDKSAEQRRTLEADAVKRARDLAEKSEGEPLSRDKVLSLRKEFDSESKPFTQIQTTFRSAVNLADRARKGDPTAQQRLTVMIEKLTDPDSVVRASEAERTLATLALMDRLAIEARGLLNARQTLTPELVDNVLANMAIMFESELDTQRARRTRLSQTLEDIDVDERRRRAVLGRRSKIDAELLEAADELRALPIGAGSRTGTATPTDQGGEKITPAAQSYLESIGVGN